MVRSRWHRLPVRSLTRQSAGILALILLSACGLLSLDNDSEDLRDLIASSRATWTEAGIQNYRVTYNRTQGQTEREDVAVTVSAGAIDSVTVQGVLQDSPDRFLTVDEMFVVVTQAFERDDRGGFQVAFNQELGFLERYRVGPGESTPGEGLVVTAFDSLSTNPETMPDAARR